MLTGEKVLSIAEQEHKMKIKNMCGLLFGVVDLLTILLIVLPFYPKNIDGYVYSVNLWRYTETTPFNRTMYWVLFFALILCGFLKILKKQSRNITICSVILSVVAVAYLALAREAYAATVTFLLLVIKGASLYAS